MATLHYIHDPLCGWCYGAAGLVAAGLPAEVVQVVGTTDRAAVKHLLARDEDIDLQCSQVFETSPIHSSNPVARPGNRVFASGMWQFCQDIGPGLYPLSRHDENATVNG